MDPTNSERGKISSVSGDLCEMLPKPIQGGEDASLICVLRERLHLELDALYHERFGLELRDVCSQKMLFASFLEGYYRQFPQHSSNVEHVHAFLRHEVSRRQLQVKVRPTGQQRAPRAVLVVKPVWKDFSGVANPKVGELFAQFWDKVHKKTFFDQFCPELQVREDGAQLRVYIKRKDGVRIPSEVFDMCGLAQLRRDLERKCRAFYGLSPQEISAQLRVWISREEIKVPDGLKSNRHVRKDNQQKKQRFSRSRARVHKEDVWHQQAGFFDTRVMEHVMSYAQRVAVLAAHFSSFRVGLRSNIDRTHTCSIFLLNVVEFLRFVMDEESSADVLLTIGDYLFKFLPSDGFYPRGVGSDWKIDDTMYFVLSLPFMPYTTSWDERMGWFLNLKRHFSRVSGPFGDAAVVSKLVSFTKWVFEKGFQCWEAKSLSPLFESTEPWTKWALDSRDIIRLEHTVGLSIDARDYFDRLSLAVERGEEMISVMRRLDDKTGLALVLSVFEQLRELQNKTEILEKVRAARSPPFYISLVGPPKTGKSALVDELCVAGYRAMGKKYNVALRYNRPPMDAFDSGLLSTNRVFVFDDLGAVSSKTGSEAMLTQLNLIMNLANDQATASVQADVKDKGKIYAQADLVIVTSNLPTFGIEPYMTVPSAFFRRIRYKVVLSVRQEFRVSVDSNVLDVNKVYEAQKVCPGYRDFHNFTVVEYVLSSPPGEVSVSDGRLNDPSLNVKVRERPILTNVNDVEFFRWYENTVKAHFVETLGMRGHAQRMVDEDVCVHDLAKGRCVVCLLETMPEKPSFVRQGGFPSKCRRECERVVVRWTSSGLDALVGYLGSSAFEYVLLKREEATAFARSLYRATGCGLRDPVVRMLVKKALAQFAIIGTAYAAVRTAEIVESTDKPLRVELKNVSNFSPQMDVVDAESYQKLLTELSVNAPLDVYSRTHREQPFDLPAGVHSISLETLVEKVKRAQVTLALPRGELVYRVAGTGIWDDVVLTVAHAFPDFPVLLHILGGGEEKRVVLTQDDVIHLDRDRDILLFKSSFRQFKDLRSFVPHRIRRVPVVDKVVFVHPFVSSFSSSSAPFVRGDKTYFGVSKQLGDGSCGGLLLAAVGKGACIVGIQQWGRAADDPVEMSLMAPVSHAFLGPSVEDSRRNIGVKPVLNLSANGLGLTADRPLVPFHRKSYVNYRTEWTSALKPVADVRYGVHRDKTRLRPTPLFGKVPLCAKQPPDFFVGLRRDAEGNEVWVSPYNTVVDQLADKRASYPPALLAKALEQVSLEFVDLAKRVPGGVAYPLTESQSLNGLPGVRFIDAFNKHTGQGLPMRGKKEQHILGEDGSRFYTEAARKCVRAMAKSLAAHRNDGIVCDLTLKDELLKPGKAIRGFAVVPFAFNDIMRRLVLPIFKVIQENSLYFGIAIGTDADSYEWRHIFEKHSSRSRHVMYDFKNFDRSHSSELLAAAHRVLFDVMHALYPDDAVVCGEIWHRVVAAGFAVTQWPIYNVNDTLFEADGSLPSGMYETAMINSICQILILRMLWIAFCEENPEYSVESFRKHVSLTTYGDDGMCSTDVEGFNLPFFARVAESWLLTITDPNKRDYLPVDFPVEEWSFLKRSFVVDHRRGWVRAPLEIESILKSLNYWEGPEDNTVLDALVERVNQAFMYLCVWETPEAEALYDEIERAFDVEWPEARLLLWSREQCRKIKYRKMEEPPVWPLFNACSRTTLNPVEFEKKFCR